MSADFIDNSPAVKSQMERNIGKALTMMGIKWQEIATKEITAMRAVDTGRLKSSLTYEVDEPNDVVIVGSNVEYAPYVHEGTSRMTGRPFISNAVQNYKDDYNEIIAKVLGGGFG